jgi:hypothetical protein
MGNLRDARLLVDFRLNHNLHADLHGSLPPGTSLG